MLRCNLVLHITTCLFNDAVSTQTAQPGRQINMIMTIEQWWTDSWHGKTEVSTDKPVSLMT